MHRVAFAPEGQRLAAAAGDGLYIVELASMEQRKASLAQNSINALAWSNDGKRIATGGKDWVVRVWDAGTLRFVEHNAGWEVRDVAFAPDDQQLAFGGRGTNVVVWNLDTRFIPLGHDDVAPDGQTFSVSFSRRGELAGAGRGWVCVWPSPIGGEPASCRSATGVVHHARFSPEGDQLAYGDEQGSVWVWPRVLKEQGRREPDKIGSFRDAILDVRFTVDGSTLVAGSLDGTVLLSNVANHRSRPLMGQRDVTQLAVGLKTIVSASHDRTIRVWPVEPEQMFPLGGEAIGDATWLPDGLS